MYIIQLNRLEGVELITKALRNAGDIASSDLADGIEQHVMLVDSDAGLIKSIGGKAVSYTGVAVTDRPVPLQSVKGGKQ